MSQIPLLASRWIKPAVKGLHSAWRCSWLNQNEALLFSEVCLKEVPTSAVTNEEVSDHVAQFCALVGYQQIERG